MAVNTVRLVVQVKERNRNALKMESLLRGKDMGEVLDDLIEEHLTEAMEKLGEPKDPPPDRGPKSRKS